MLAALLTMLVVIPVPGRDQRDVVELQNGRSIRGRVVLELDDVVYVRVGSRERKIPRAKVKSISSVFHRQWQVLEQFQRLQTLTAKALLALADQSHEAELEHTESLLCWRALQLTPGDATINTRLGHKLYRGEWRVPGAGGGLPLARADQVRSTQDKPWELRSEHFQVKSSCPLFVTVDVLLDLEFFYQHFFRMWQKPLELREVIDPIAVSLYRDRAEFPGFARSSWFDPNRNVLYLWRPKPLERPWEQFYSATLAVLGNSGGHGTRHRRLPHWLALAWPDYMSSIVRDGAPGRPAFDPGRTSDWHIEQAKGSRTKYGIEQIVRLTRDDYSVDGDVKTARGYVLLYYLIRKTTEQQRERLYAYLRGALSGKGQFRTFRKFFKADLETLEAGFQKFASLGK